MRPSATCRRALQWPKFGKLTIASRPTRSISRRTPSVWRTACSVCERITQSNDWSENSDSPLSRSTCSTLTSFDTQASTLSNDVNVLQVDLESGLSLVSDQSFDCVRLARSE